MFVASVRKLTRPSALRDWGTNSFFQFRRICGTCGSFISSAGRNVPTRAIPKVDLKKCVYIYTWCAASYATFGQFYIRSFIVTNFAWPIPYIVYMIVYVYLYISYIYRNIYLHIFTVYIINAVWQSSTFLCLAAFCLPNSHLPIFVVLASLGISRQSPGFPAATK